MSATRWTCATAVASGLAIAAAAPAAQARDWTSYLGDTKVQNARGGSLRAVLWDQIDVRSTAAPAATLRVKGGARATFTGTAMPPYIKLVDQLIVSGVSINSVTAGSGGWSVTGGSTRKTLSYTRTLRSVRNNAHTYNGLTVSGALRKIEHQTTGTTTLGTLGVSAQAYDSCGVFNVCR
jgi:hypothetical protein